MSYEAERLERYKKEVQRLQKFGAIMSMGGMALAFIGLHNLDKSDERVRSIQEYSHDISGQLSDHFSEFDQLFLDDTDLTFSIEQPEEGFCEGRFQVNEGEATIIGAIECSETIYITQEK